MTSKQELEVLFFEKKLSIEEISKMTDHWIPYIRQKLGLGSRNKIKYRRIDWGGYIYVRDKNGKWILEHRKVWEDTNGPIPDGYIIHHENENKHDSEKENLSAMTRSKHSSMTLKNYWKRLKARKLTRKDFEPDGETL